jgi:multiple sugar transport system substrate-binding protein
MRATLKEAAFRKGGAEIAEVGTTWISGFVGMNVLRPFTPSEVSYIQKEGDFLPLAWKTMSPENNNPVLSIPWSADARVIYYWADMFEEANVDPQTAFKDVPSFEAALEQLQSRGIQTPWIAATALEANTVFHTGMWIWQHGGDFLSGDGKKVLFIEPPAMKGILEYFSLHRFMPNTVTPLAEGDILERFFNREVAYIITGRWLLNRVLHNSSF